MSQPQAHGVVELIESDLNDVQGGLLLPAIQKVRDAASRMSCMTAGENVTVLDRGAN